VHDQIAYLDHAATTPLRPEARAAMLPWLGERFGNPSGAHRVARAARQAVDEARDAVAEVVGCAPGDVVFTGGGTEADNLAVRGVHAARPGAVLCSAVEHDAVLLPVAHLGGCTVPVDGRGVIDLDALADLLDQRDDVTLVSVMVANNEVGTVQPVAAVADVVRRHAPGAAVHADAVQAAAWLPLADRLAGTHLVSLSSHKVGGPQGVGALAVRRGTPLRPLMLGGGQERELRSGTHNVAGIVGFAAALRAAVAQRADTARRVRALRDRLAEGLVTALPGTVVTGVPDDGASVQAGGEQAGGGHAGGGHAGGEQAGGGQARGEHASASHAADDEVRLPGTLHVCLPGVESEALLFLLDEAGVCASAAAACASGAQQASHVLAAMRVPAERSRGALRLSLGWSSVDADVDHALRAIPASVARLRAVPA
jgi:cysteine desulfurase